MKSRSRTIAFGVGAAALLFALMVFAVRYVQFHGFFEPGTWEACRDRQGTYHHNVFDERDRYFSCLDDLAKRYIERDYAEAKDLSKAFLTLLTAVLVASITFSEKIVEVTKAGKWANRCMFACWSLVLLAIATCGIGLTLMSIAAGAATYMPQTRYQVYEGYAITSYLVSGVSFVVALGCLLVAGITSRHDKLLAPETSREPRRQLDDTDGKASQSVRESPR